VGGFQPDKNTMYMFGTGTSEPTHMCLHYQDLTLTSNFHLQAIEERLPGFGALTNNAKLLAMLDVSSFMAIDAQCLTSLVPEKTVR
jgi:hypothetical protein